MCRPKDNQDLHPLDDPRKTYAAQEATQKENDLAGTKCALPDLLFLVEDEKVSGSDRPPLAFQEEEKHTAAQSTRAELEPAGLANRGYWH